MLTCCPVVVHPPFVWPRVSWPSCLSFALQLALVRPVTVGSLLPYGSQPSRWGHPCGVEASLSSIVTKVSFVFSSPFGLFLHVVTALRDIVTIWSGVLVGSHLCATNGCRWCLALSPSGWDPLSEASLNALSLQGSLLGVLAGGRESSVVLDSLQCSSLSHVVVTWPPP